MAPRVQARCDIDSLSMYEVEKEANIMNMAFNSFRSHILARKNPLKKRRNLLIPIHELPSELLSAILLEEVLHGCGTHHLR